GVTGATTKDEDFVVSLFVASTHDHLLMFTSKGRAYLKRVYELPEGSRAARGKALINLLELQEGERVVEMLPIKEFPESREDEDQGPFVVFATKKGVVKKTPLGAYANIRSTG